MATWQHLRSSTANKRPTTSLADGRIAINTNTASPGLFFKDSAGTGIVKVGPVHVGTTAPNSVPAAGGSSGNYTGEQWLDTSVSPAQMKVWNGSTWVGIVADELPVSKLQDGAARQLIQTDAAGTGVEWTSDVDVPGTLDVTSTATFDSIAQHPLGTAGAPTITFTGDNNTGIYSPGADQVAISTNGSGRLFVDASGRVSVGLSSPARDFVVYRATAPSLHIQNSTSGTSDFDGLGVQLVGADASIVNYENGFLNFFTNSTERLRITAAGLVGVGTSSPSTLLHIQSTDPAFRFKRSDAGTDAYGELTTDTSGLVTMKCDPANAAAGSGFRITVDNSEALRVDSSGRLGIGTSSPSANFDARGTVALSQMLNIDGNSGSPITASWAATSAGAKLMTLSNTAAGGSIGNGNTLYLANYSNDNGIFARAFNVTTGGTDRFWVGSNGAGYFAGSVGIGTTSPSALLHLNAPAPALLIARSSAAGTPSATGLQLSIDGTTYGRIYATSSGGIGFSGPTSDYATLDNSGRLLVGTSSARTDLIGGTRGGRIQLEAASSSATTAIDDSSLCLTAGCDGSGGGAVLQGGANLYITRTYSNSLGGKSLVGNNAKLGGIVFSGTDGTSAVAAATIESYVDGTSGANDMPGRLVFSTTPDSGSSPVERLRIASNGKTTIKGATSDSSAYSLEVTESGGIVQFTIRNDGVILTGTDTLSPYNNTTASAANLFVTSGGELQRSTSSLKYKKNVQDAPYGLQELMALRAVTYQGKSTSDGDTVYGGLIAEEVDAAGLQEFVQYADDGTPDALAYGNMVSLCIKAIQEQQEMIAELQTKVAALESA